jgi:predicted alpha/beta-fold hydrolase
MTRNHRANSFRPLPLLGNPHVQTVLANALPGWSLRYPSEERQVALPDGDQLLVHDSAPNDWSEQGRVAILVHGLGGCHRSGYMQRVARLLLGRGMRVVRMDLRGAGGGVGLARKPYHGGCSDDVRAVVEEVQSHCPGSPLTLVGFSLGANIVLKLAGESVDRPVPGLEKVAALAPPIDFENCADLLALPRNRFYERYYVRALLRLVRQRQWHFPDDPVPPFPSRLKLRQFDELYTAPRCGFQSATHYYRTVSSLPLVPRILVPTLIVTARDDPFIAVESFESLSVGPHIEIEIAAQGGHLGFLGWDNAGGFRWAEERIAQWVVRAN